MAENHIDNLAAEKTRLSKKLYYYKKISMVKTLNAQQQKIYDETRQRLKELKDNDMEAKKEKYINSIERNREQSRLRYYNNPKYQFGTLKFINKKTCFEYMKNYIETHENIDPADYDNLVSFISHHPNGFNPEHDKLIITRDSFHYYTRCFGVLHEDGTIEPRSYKTTLNGRNNKADVIALFREAVKNDIKEFRDTNSNVCDECKQELNGNINIHHEIPFSDMLNEFLRINHINIDDIKINYENRHEEEEISEEDRKIIEKWKEYHKTNSKLKMLCVDCHRKLHHD